VGGSKLQFAPSTATIEARQDAAEALHQVVVREARLEV
jgi:hypothetical protein